MCLNIGDLNSFILPTFCDNTILPLHTFYLSLPFEHVNKYLESFFFFLKEIILVITVSEKIKICICEGSEQNQADDKIFRVLAPFQNQQGLERWVGG